MVACPKNSETFSGERPKSHSPNSKTWLRLPIRAGRKTHCFPGPGGISPQLQPPEHPKGSPAQGSPTSKWKPRPRKPDKQTQALAKEAGQANTSPGPRSRTSKCKHATKAVAAHAHFFATKDSKMYTAMLRCSKDSCPDAALRLRQECCGSLGRSAIPTQAGLGSSHQILDFLLLRNRGALIRLLLQSLHTLLIELLALLLPRHAALHCQHYGPLVVADGIPLPSHHPLRTWRVTLSPKPVRPHDAAGEPRPCFLKLLHDANFLRLRH